MKALILYYSYGGNTREIAQRIQKMLDCDSAEIETVTPYPEDYNIVVNQGQKEIDRGYQPPIRPLKYLPADYDTIILGTPVWWYTYAPAVLTLLSSADWNGKTIYPFATNGGWLGHTFSDIANICHGADIKNGLNIRFNGKHLHTSYTEIDEWVEQIKQEVHSYVCHR